MTDGGTDKSCASINVIAFVHYLVNPLNMNSYPHEVSAMLIIANASTCHIPSRSCLSRGSMRLLIPPTSLNN